MDVHEAAIRGTTLDIESALEADCDINACNNYGSKTALQLAVERGNLEACRVLIGCGALVEGSNILELAVQGGQIELVELLWPHGEGAAPGHDLESINIDFGIVPSLIADLNLPKAALEELELEHLKGQTLNFKYFTGTAQPRWHTWAS